MAQGFYSLEEAANVLGVAPDELNQMAQRREIRAFADRGTWKFRTQDVDQAAQKRGVSAPAAAPAPTPATGGDLLPLSDDAPAPRKTSAPRKSEAKPKTDGDLIPVDDDIFGADLDAIGSSGGLDAGDDVLLGGDVGGGSGSKTATGSDKLVMEKASFEFDLNVDSDVRLDDDSATKKKTKSPSSGRLAPVPAKPGGDSDVRLDFASDPATLDDDLPGLADMPSSGVRLESQPAGDLLDDPGSYQTEEVDLDAELQQANDASMKRRDNKTKAFPPPAAPGAGKTNLSPQAKGTMLPAGSPFELSEDDLDAGAEAPASVNQPMGSEFELTLAPEESPLSLDEDEDVDLGDLPPRGADGSSSNRAELSGINLHNPADSGLSLEEDEEADDSVSFDLTLDEGDTGPKTIKGKLPPAEESDSEFELTLDEGALSSSPSLGGGSGTVEEKDIFETDFDLPALDDESASQAVALDEADTDLESSDFDLAVPSGTNIDQTDSGEVALEEEPTADPDLSSVDEMLVEDQEEEGFEDIEEEEAVATVPAAQAEWGLFEVLTLVPCVVLMFLSGLMAYELLQGSSSYHGTSKPGGVLVKSIAGLVAGDENLPKD